MNRKELDTFLDNILEELQYRIEEGTINLKNSTHISILSEILHEYGMSDLLSELDSVTKPSSKHDDEYSHQGNGVYVRKGDEEKEGSAKFKKDDNGNYKPMSDAEAEDIKAKAGEVGGSNNNPVGQPEDGSQPADVGGDSGMTGGGADVPRVNIFNDKEYQARIASYEAEASGNDGELYSLGNGYYSSTPNGPREFKKVNEAIKSVVGGGTVNVIRINHHAEKMKEIYSDGKLLSSSTDALALLNNGYNKKAKYSAPGNAGSAYNETLSNEGVLLLDKYPDMSEYDLINILFHRTKNTALGEQQKTTPIKGLKIPSDVPRSQYNVYKSAVLAAKSAITKYDRAALGSSKLYEEFGFDVTRRRVFGGTQSDLHSLIGIIESAPNCYIYDADTQKSISIPSEILKKWASSSGGGQNAGDTVILSLNESGDLLYDGWSDKKNLNDIQANSTLNYDYTKSLQNLLELKNTNCIDDDVATTASSIINKYETEVSNIEINYKNTVVQEADFMKTYIGADKTRLLKLLQQQSDKYDLANTTNHVIERKEFLKKKGLIGDSNEEFLSYILENLKSLTNSERKIVSRLSDAERKYYRSIKTPIPAGLDTDDIISKLREAALIKQKEMYVVLNQFNGRTTTGKHKKLGDLIGFRDVINELHLDKIELPINDIDYSQYLKRNTNLVMGGISVTPDNIRKCMGVNNINDLEDNFETILEENITTDVAGNRVTGKRILIYAVRKGSERKFLAEKVYRSKDGKTGKTSNTIQWSKDMQNCFAS